MSEPLHDDSDAFLAAFLHKRLAERNAGAERSLAEYCRMFPGHEELIRQAWAESSDGLAQDPQQSAPTTIGPYRLLRCLGRGGQGEVWLGEDPRLARRVAIKLLRGVAFATADGLARFRREAAAASRLDHPGICAVYDAGFESGMPYLVMRYLEGRPLAEVVPQLVPRAGPQLEASLRRLAGIVEALARALDAAHAAGVLHRDVKPQNVMLVAGDVPVLLDFGLARLVDDDTLFTRTGDLAGTPAYLAPEQLVTPPSPPDRSTDIYALGIVLYECLTGQRPFAAPTLDSLYRRILAGAAPAARAANRDVPHDLSVVTATAMERDAKRRYATAGAFADDLRRWLDRRPILAQPAGPGVRLRRWRQRNPALASAVTALLVTLLAGLVTSVVLWRTAAVAGERATRLLGEWEQLADLRRLDELRQEADHGLWPAVPDKVPAMTAWLRRAEPLTQRLAEHQRVLARLGSVGAGEDDATAWRRQHLEELVRGLVAFTAADPFQPTVASVVRRRALALELERWTRTSTAAWTAAIDRVARNADYRGLVLTPQLGLVPLGPDPQSGLEEFADPQTGDVPGRGAHGQLECGESTGVVFVLLPGGTFVMGAQNSDPRAQNFDPSALIVESPPHPVELAPFLLAKHELTQAQWQMVMGDNPSASQPGRTARGHVVGRRCPVENVSWLRCTELASRCGWVLPTEAQWEYGCRAGTGTPWSTGSEAASLFSAANFADAASRSEYPRDWAFEPDTDDGYAVPAPVGSYRPNRFGLHDMHGNVREWCHDRMRHYGSPVAPGTGERLPQPDKPPGPSPMTARVTRGGSCMWKLADLRSAFRNQEQVGMQFAALGLRPARPLSR